MTTDTLYDTEQQQRPEDALAQQIETNDLLSLMGTEWGRRFMWRLLGHCRVFHLSYTGEQLATCFNEGQRNVGLRFITDIHLHCPEKYTLMVQENKGK